MNDSNNPFGPVIFSYSRARAIADGVLVNLTAGSESIRRTWVHHMACIDAGAKHEMNLHVGPPPPEPVLTLMLPHES